MGKSRAPSPSDFAYQVKHLGEAEAIALCAPGREYPKVTVYRWQNGWNMFFWSADRRLVNRRRDYDVERIVGSVQEFVDSLEMVEAEVRFPER